MVPFPFFLFFFSFLIFFFFFLFKYMNGKWAFFQIPFLKIEYCTHNTSQENGQGRKSMISRFKIKRKKKRGEDR